MMPAKNFRRELLLICLPLILFGGAMTWIFARQKAQRERETGPFRAAIIRVETLPLTPAQIFRGFDRHIRIYVESRGQFPSGLGIKRLENSYWNTFLEMDGQRNGKKVRIPTTTLGNITNKDPYEVKGPLAVLDRRSEEGQEQFFDCFLDTSPFSTGAVTLQGPISTCQWVQSDHRLSPAPHGFAPDASDPTHQFKATSEPAQLSFTVRKADEAIAPTVDRNAPEVRVDRGVLCSPHMRESHWIDALGDYQFVVRVAGTDPAKGELYPFYFYKAQLWDAKGQLVKTLVDEHDWKQRGYDTQTTPGFYNIECGASWADVPASRGPLWLRGFVSVHDGWPAPFSVQVRRDEDINPPKHLALRSIRYLSPDKIQVALHYSGKKDLETIDDSRGAPQGIHDMREASGNVFAIAPDADHDRLLSRWSERLVGMKGEPSWDAVRANDVLYHGNGNYTVVYKIDRSIARKMVSPLTFRAEIGLQDEGFLPVQLPIPNA